MAHQTDWQQKVVLVTGASAGLGRAIAEEFAAAGAAAVMAARGAERLEAAADALRQAGHRVLAVPTDVGETSEVEALVARAVAEFGRLDVLVNNVGQSARGLALETGVEQFVESLDVNLLATVRSTRAAAPHVIAAQGSIVNISSLAGKAAARFLGAYPAAKHALSAYTQQLRLELAADGVHVLLVCSGPIARDDAQQRYVEQSADLPESARKPGAGVRAKATDPHWLARRIVRACERRQGEIVVPAKARLLFALAQLSPRLGDALLRRLTG